MRKEYQNWKEYELAMYPKPKIKIHQPTKVRSGDGRIKSGKLNPTFWQRFLKKLRLILNRN
jgi:hypothetical protein